MVKVFNFTVAEYPAMTGRTIAVDDTLDENITDGDKAPACKILGTAIKDTFFNISPEKTSPRPWFYTF